jgi:NADPH-dependent 2,4-dienoyl-CoA reductase/sulfur reductase-like enzyme
MAKQTFVIAGASLAGAKAAEALRDEGFDGRVVLVGAEVAASARQRGSEVTILEMAQLPLDRVLGP